jgi:hypothetical protein
VTRFGAAASKRPAADIVRTRRNSVACTYNCACVLCVSGNSYLYHHIFKRIVGEYLHVEIQGSFDKYIPVTFTEVCTQNVLQCRKIHLLYLDKKRSKT